MDKKKLICVFVGVFFILPTTLWHFLQTPKKYPEQLLGLLYGNIVYGREADDPIMAYNPLLEMCESFDFVPSEWTLIWKKKFRNELESLRCIAQLKDIFETKQVKWVIHLNKSIENLGCTKNSPICHPGAHFDKVRNFRINTPPCCRQKILFVFETVTKGLQELNIPHVLFYGGVLGWARNRQLIPYDEDLDLAINGTFWRSSTMMNFLEDICKKHGFVTKWTSGNESFGIRYSETNRNGMGVWSYRMIDGKVWVTRGRGVKRKNKEWDYDIINPPRRVNFNGIQTYVPNKPIEFVDQSYGVGRWRWKLMECKRVESNNKCIA